MAIGGTGNSSPKPLIFPDNRAIFTKIKPVPKERRTVSAYSEADF